MQSAPIWSPLHQPASTVVHIHERGAEVLAERLKREFTLERRGTIGLPLRARARLGCMIAFDWSRTVVKAEGARTWIEIPFTDASPLHERVAMIPVVAAMAAEASGQSWRGIEVGRRQVRAWADGADAVDRDQLREHLTKAAGQAEREAGKHAHTARMATEAAQRHLEAAEEQAERLGEDIRGS